MIDSFLVQLLFLGVALAALAAPLGSIMVWKRLAFFGDTLAHGAILGLAFAVVLDFPSATGLIVMAVLMALLLMKTAFRGTKSSKTSTDTLMSIMSHGGLALGLIAVSFLGIPLSSLTGILFGDILAVSGREILGVSVLALAGMASFWGFRKSVLSLLISEDLAVSQGIKTQYIKLGFAIFLGLTIGVLLKVVGALLMTALLIIPAAAARLMAHSPLGMIMGAGLLCYLSYLLGLFLSFAYDLPTGPAVVSSALLFYVFMQLFQNVGLKSKS